MILKSFHVLEEAAINVNQDALWASAAYRLFEALTLLEVKNKVQFKLVGKLWSIMYANFP